MRRTTRGRIGVAGGLALAFVSVAGLALPWRSVAQTAGPTTEPAKIQREAYFTAEADGAVPATLTAEFPPGLACILIPQVCSAEAQRLTDPLGNVVEPVTNPDMSDHLAPQPVEEGTLPVSMLGGKPRHTSYLQFTLPGVPEGSMVDRFDLILSQTEVSYALESPAFRQATLAALVTYQNRTDPEAYAEFVKLVGDIANRTTPLAQRAPTGIELCAVTGTWESAESADAASQPPRDCIFGANGVFDPEAGTWTFDMSLLAQAWLDGTMPNEGVYLGPIGAANLAFGDPDTSTNWQVSLGGRQAEEPKRPRIRYAVSPGFGEELGLGDSADLGLDDSTQLEEFSGGVVSSTDPFSTTIDDSLLAGGVPEVGDPVAGPTGRARGALAAQSSPRTPWWLWLLLPTGLALAYAYSRGIEEVPGGGPAPSGALTRLMATSDTTTTP